MRCKTPFCLRCSPLLENGVEGCALSGSVTFFRVLFCKGINSSKNGTSKNGHSPEFGRELEKA